MARPEPGIRARFSTWLLRPYLDLGPFAEGPLHARAVEECWLAFSDPTCPQFIPQRALPPGFRRQLSEEAGGAPYDLDDPRELPEGLRTDRWRRLCAALEGWNDLPYERRCRLASLLHSLCLYRPLLDLIPAGGPGARDGGSSTADLAFWRASAKYMSGLRGRTAEYGVADMAMFTEIALHAGESVPACFNATAMVFVHKAKTRAPLQELIEWGRRYERALADAVPRVDDFPATLLTSRYYRGMGFLPQRTGNRDGVVRTMDLAERHALDMQPQSSAEEHLYRENLHALMESRTKEALWLGDKDRALASALKVTEVDPHDSKAWVELGQVRFSREEWREAARAYAVAATLGPPASAVGRHMAALCLRKLGEDALAALLFKDTLEIDPLGISPREEIYKLPDFSVRRAIEQWARSTVCL